MILNNSLALIMVISATFMIYVTFFDKKLYEMVFFSRNEATLRGSVRPSVGRLVGS